LLADDFAITVYAITVFAMTVFAITLEDGTTFGKVGRISHRADPSRAVRGHVEVAEPSEISVNQHGNVAIVTGAGHEKGTSKGKLYEYRDRRPDVWRVSEAVCRQCRSDFRVASLLGEGAHHSVQCS